MTNFVDMFIIMSYQFYAADMKYDRKVVHYTMRASTMKGRDLVGVALDSHVPTAEKGGADKGRYLDVQLNAADIRDNTPEVGQANLHAVTRKGTNGRTTNEAFYAKSQFDAIVAAAGDKTQPIMSKDGKNQIGTAYSIHADLIPATGKNPGLMIKTDSPMTAGPDIPADILKQQGAYMHQASVAKKEAKAATRAVPTVAAEVNAPQAEAEVG